MTAANIFTSAVLPSAEQTIAAGVAARTIRFGVAFRLLIAFAAITAFAAATSVVALYTFNKYGDGFNRIASSSLPALVAASNLAQRSQALAANAPNLAVADGHFARRAVSEALGSQLKEIAEAGEQVKSASPGNRRPRQPHAQRSLAQRQPSEARRVGCGKARSRPRGGKLYAAASNAFRSNSRGCQRSVIQTHRRCKTTRVQADALSAWTQPSDEAIVILLSTASADTTIRLNRLRSEFAEVRNRAQTARAQLPPDFLAVS